MRELENPGFDLFSNDLISRSATATRVDLSSIRHQAENEYRLGKYGVFLAIIDWKAYHGVSRAR